MAFREVTMLEVKEILRLWLTGVPKRRIGNRPSKAVLTSRPGRRIRQLIRAGM